MRSPATLWRQLRRTSPRELMHRVHAAVRDDLAERLWAMGWRIEPAPRHLNLSVADLNFDRSWLGSDELDTVSELLRREYPNYVQSECAAAFEIRAHRFRFFGRAFGFDRAIPWCHDPLTGSPWPMRFHTRIDIFAGADANTDVKYVWELNRHQFLPTLGKAYRLTGDEGHAAEGLRLIENWIEANPYKIGINWTSALEVAVRALSWCWACALFEGSSALERGRRENIARSLLQHAHFIMENLSLYFSPYNHLVGEAAALYAIGTLLPGLPGARRFRNRGGQLLASEMPRQFAADGGTVEQATGYHHFTLGFYLQGVLLRKRFDPPIPKTMLDLMERAFEYSQWLARPDGSTPMIGDGDEGKALDLRQTDPWRFSPYLAAGATLLHRPDFKWSSGPFPPDVMWLVGPADWERYGRLPAAPPGVSSRMFRDSGYGIFRSGFGRKDHYLLFDCGPIADGLHPDDVPSAAHGHADALSIEVCAHGEPVLVDPGFFTYNGPILWHRHFREAIAHNTLVVDRASQAEFRGRLKWSHAPTVRLLHWEAGRNFDFAEAEHTGYGRLPGAPLHRRSVAFVRPDYFVVRDHVMGSGTHTIDRMFQAPPGAAVERPDTARFEIRAQGGAGLSIVLADPEPARIEVHEGGDGPDEGWVAPGYEQKVPAPLVRVRVTSALPITLYSILVPFTSGPVRVMATLRDWSPERGGEHGEELSLTVGTRSDRIRYAAPSGAILTPDKTHSEIARSGGDAQRE